VTDFKPRDFSLLPVALDTIGPLVFANGDPKAAPLGDVYEGLPQRLEMAGRQVRV